MAPRHSGSVRTSSPWSTLRRWLPVVVAAGVGAGVVAQQPATPADPPKAAPMPMPAGEKKPEPADAKTEKLYDVKYDNTEWSKVFEQLEKETGLMYITKDKPTGSVTLKPPAGKKYTLGELIDLLNERLELDKFVILRKSVSFSTVPADVNIAKDYKQHVQTVTAEELFKRGKTEIVQMIMPLVSLQADEVRPQVGQLLSPFGVVSAFGTDKLLVLDKAANVRSVYNLVQDIIKDKGDQFYHVCKFKRASFVAETLRGLLKDSTTDVNTGSAAAVPQFNQWGGGGWQQTSPQAGRTDTRRFRSVNITVDDKQNSLTMTGPVDKINAAKELVKEIDKGGPGEEPRPTGGEPVWKPYTVKSGTAEAMGKLLMEDPRFKGSSVKVLAIGTNELNVYGYLADHLEIAEFFKSPPSATPSVENKVVALPAAYDATMTADLASKVKAAIANGLVADPKPDGEPGIILRGSPDIIKQAEDYIRQVTGPALPGGGGLPGNPNYREVTIPNANAGALAEHLAEMMKKMGKNPVVVDPNAPPPKKRPPADKPMNPGGQPMGPGAAAPSQLSPNRVLKASYQQPGGPALADPEKKPDVVFTVVGDKIIITGDDPKAVQLAYELMAVYTTAKANKATERYEVIPLKNVSAEDAAKVITEVFNGPPANSTSQPQGGRGGFNLNPIALLGQLSGAGASAPTDPTKGRVRVVAEKTSNSLIVVKASETDLVTIKHLLAKAINSDEPPEGGVSKTWVIKLKHSKASEMVVTIRNVFANYTGRNQRGGGGQQAFNPFVPQQPQAAQPAALSVDYDIDTNWVVVNCTEPIYLEVKALCDELDKASKESGDVTAILTSKDLEGVAPSVVRDLVDTLAGRQPTSQQGGFGNRGQNPFGGGMGGNPFGGGFGGGNPFGGGGGGNPFGGGGGFPGGGRGGAGNFGGGNFGGGGRGVGGMGGGMGNIGGGGRGGMGGGNFGGGGMGGGGGNRGGGMGGGRGGRAQRSAEITAYYDGGGGGPRPFDYAGTDAPSTPSLLFDPEAEQPDEGSPTSNSHHGPRPFDVRLAAHYDAPPQRLLYLNPMADPAPATLPGVYQAQATQPQPGGTQPPAGQPRPPAQPGGQSVITAPNPDTTAIVSPDGTQLVIRARNEEELQRIIGVIKALLPTLKRESQVELKIVPLQYADSTLTVNELTQIFARLTVQGNGLTLRNQQQGLGFGGFNLQNQALGNVVLFPLPRMNAILLGAPKASEEVIIAQIKTLDQPNTAVLQPVRYPLKRAAAAIVQQQILNLFRLRYPSDQGNNLQVTVDTANNAVLVQAGPADQKDIAAFIELLDVEPGANGAVNDIKVIRLRNAFASEMAQILFEVLQNNVYNPQASATSSGGGGGQQLQGAFATGAQGAFGQQQFGQQQGGVQLTGGTTASTKTTVLRMRDVNGRPVADSGILADVSVTPDARINALIVAAPEKTMKMIEALVTELDGVAAAKSYVKLFQLKKADATAVQTLLFNLFSRQQQTGAGAIQGGFGGQGGFGTAQTQGVTRPLLTLTGNPGDGSALIDLRITVDTRTNSLIVGGSQNDLDLVDSVIRRLEATDTPQILTEVVKLKNAAAADVQTALTQFLAGVSTFSNNLQNLTGTATFTGIQRQTYFVQAEPITNQLIIGAPPQLMADILRLIQAVDAAPPQVYVEVLVAEVRLNNQEEFGVEVGLQSNVLFARGGATTSSPGSPGYNFNTTSALPNAANASPNVVGFQGLGNLGTGRASPTLGVGGFVLSAASDTFNLLIRALKAQGRLDVLSRPSLTLADNQTGFFQVGQNYPQITASTLNAQGFVQNSITYTPIGVVLRVTPRISPDGQVLMRVEPQVSSVSQTQVQIGNGVLASAIDTQTVETTVLAGDGETVVLGGLISKRDEKAERKIPWVGDLPWVGAAFRFRTQVQERREVIFIMTPRIMRSVNDMRAVLAAEAKKMSWSIQDVANVTGVNPDVIRGKAAGDLCLDNITGPAPAYLPLSGTGAIAPTYYPGAVYGQNPVAAPVPTAGAPAVPAATYPVVPPAIYPTQPTAAQPPTPSYPTGALPVQPGVVAPPAAASVPGNVPGVVAPPAVQPTAFQPAPATPPAGYTPTAAAGGPPTGQQPWGR